MKIKTINCKSYTLTLKQTLQNAKNQYSKKDGFIIEIITDHEIGYGDISPLQGFSKETIQEIGWTFQAFLKTIDFNIDYSFDEILDLVEIHCSEIPSLHFAMDTALYDIKGKKHNMPISKLLNPKCNNQIKLSSIYLHGNVIKKLGVNCIKYKLGMRPIDQDIKILHSISKHNPSIKFRFDANQCYTLEIFITIYQQLKSFNIDYFEEPIKKPDKNILQKIKKQSNTNIAIDESIHDGNNYASWIRAGLIDVVIIKPSIFGGYKKILTLCQLCKQHQIKIILSSSLESSLGNMATMHLAAAIENNHEHGLNIYDFYDHFIASPIYTKNQSSVTFNQITGLGLRL